MSRHIIAVFTATVLVCSNLAASAQALAVSVPSTESSSIAKNNAPLAPGRAASIREAQGVSDRGVLIASGLILAGIVAAMLLIDDDDDAVTTTGSNS